jgi:hypothetical protein
MNLKRVIAIAIGLLPIIVFGKSLFDGKTDTVKFLHIPINLCPLYTISGDNLRGDKEKEAGAVDHQDQRILVPEKLSAAEKHQIKRDHRREWLNPGRTQYEEDDTYVRLVRRDDRRADRRRYSNRRRKRADRLYDRASDLLDDPDDYFDGYTRTTRTIRNRRKRADQLNDRVGFYDPDYDDYTRTTRTDIRNLDDLEDCAKNCYLYLNTKSLCNCIESECGVDCDDFLN